jgi:DNA-binding NtrC family response regulator
VQDQAGKKWIQPKTMTKNTVLVVDDEPLLRTYVRDLLQEAGYAVKEAANADGAIGLLEDDGIIAVLTDIEMPGTLNGIDLVWMIRTRWPTLPVVVTSGKHLPNPGDLPANTQFVTKPFSPERLLSVVKASA